MAVGDVKTGPALSSPWQKWTKSDGTSLAEIGGITNESFYMPTSIRQVAPSGAERQYEMAYNDTMVGTTDGVSYPYPSFRLGRIVNGPYGPKFRWLFYDTSHGERTVAEFERGGTFAMVLVASTYRSVYEAFYPGETYPLFRVGVASGGPYIEFRHPTSDTNDYIRMSRDGTNEIFRFWDPGGSSGDYNRLLDCQGLKNQDGIPLKFIGNYSSIPAVLQVTANAATVPCNTSNVHAIDLSAATGTVTLDCTKMKAGQEITLLVTQDSPARSLSWKIDGTAKTAVHPSGSAYSGGGAGSYDMLKVRYDGTYMIVRYWNSLA